jgi:hypothetical protein
MTDRRSEVGTWWAARLRLPPAALRTGGIWVMPRDESGTTGLPAYGYLDRGALLAVACLGLWHEMPTLGVLTHPAHRGRGLVIELGDEPTR